MSVRVRDLEIALVLAREMKAAAERSVDASLRLEQLQEVFGAPQLDQAERARIQTALQMAGLEPHPSLLEADPADAIRFVAAAAAPAATVAGGAGGAGGADAAGAAGPPGVPPPPDPPPPAADPPPTFPTVGQFARSKFGRSRRARRAARDDHGGAPSRPVPAAEEEAGDEPAADVTAEYAVPVEPEVTAADAETDAELEAEAEMLAAEAEAAAAEDEPAAAEAEPEFDVADAEAEERVGAFESEAGEAGEPEVAEPDPEVAEPEHEPEPADAEAAEPESEPEPAAAEAAEPVARHPEPDLPGLEFPESEQGHEPPPYAPPPLTYEPPAPEPARAGAGVEEVVAALLPAVAIPVIVTSIAGWRFGLPFVALSVIATGWLLGREPHAGGAKRGMLATLRESPAAASVLKVTAVVTVLGVVASVLLASVGKNSTTRTAAPARKSARPAAAAKPSPTPATSKHRSHKAHTPTATQPAQANPPTGPPPDPHTAGLVRVPPKSTATPGTGQGGTTGTGTGTGAQTGTGSAPNSAPPPGTGTQPHR